MRYRIPRHVRHSVAAIAGLLALGTLPASPALAQDELPDSPGKAELVQVCTQCHAIGIVIQQDHAPDEWDELMQRMVGMGAPATPEQQKAILAYLKKNFVRRAPAAAVGPARAPGAAPRSRG